MARWLLALTVVATFAVACDDGSGPAKDTPADTVDTPSDQAPADLQPADQPTGDDSATPDVAPDVADVPPEDLPREVGKDDTPPTVASSDPANEATDVPIPFVVKVTFSEAIRYQETVDSSTFRLVNMYGENVPGERSYDETTFTVTFTPDAGVVFQRGSSYRVVMNNMIQDKAGNRMAATTISFSTTLGPNLQEYETLAIKYSPLLYQSVSKTAPQFDYPTAYDFDDNWQASDNDLHIRQAQSIPSWVYYDVVESKSHFFIRYAYFYPRHMDGDNSFGNDLSGAMVVVAKRPTETPIAVETYYATASKEDWRTYVTTESNIVVDGKGGQAANGNLNDIDRKYYSVNWVFPQSTLFPGGHYQAYLTTGKHESCAWVQTNQEFASDSRCQLNDGIRQTLSVMRYTYADGIAAPITKGGDGFPVKTLEGEDIGYGLRSVLKDFWVRRDRVGDMFGSSFTYSPPEGRPGGTNTEAPTSFVNPMSEDTPGGRPPFAWSWAPSAFDTDFYFKEFPTGTPFLDPAYYFAQRHKIPLTPTKEGFSSTYCFNVYFMVDQRSMDPDCAR